MYLLNVFSRAARGVALTLCLASAMPLATAAPAGVPIPRRYLFLDPALLESMNHAQLAVHAPQRRETVIRPDRPWEQLMISFFLTVRDEGGALRMWYICRDKENHANVAYAESRDGIVWTKPDLGIVDYAGSKANNLVGLKNLEGVVFIDPKAPPAERYAYVSSAKSAGNGTEPTGIYRFHSPDGLHWTRDEVPLIRCGSDTQNVTFWDERAGAYAVYFRGWTPDRWRRVLRVTLPDLHTPLPRVPQLGAGKYFNDEVPVVLQCDEQDPSRTDIYNIAAQPYPLDPAWYVGFPGFLRRTEACVAPGYHGSHRGQVEVQFVGSRDGEHWNRYDRAAYASPGVSAPDKKNMNFMGTGLVVRGDEIWQYGTEFESEHGDMAARQRKTDGVIVRYVQRVDGFVALTTSNERGDAQTMALAVAGRKLLLNVNTGSLGELRVGLVDQTGQPIAGYSLADCDAVQGNATGLPVTWHGQGDLSAVAGRKVHLQFQSRRTQLFSFRFE